jgi:hypothetical protein
MPKIICPQCGEPNNDINSHCLKCKGALRNVKLEAEKPEEMKFVTIDDEHQWKHFMSKVRNLENLSLTEVNYELSKGAKFVIYEYCMSFVVVTVTRKSDIYFIRSNKSSLKYSLGFSLISLLLGWWGIPWGPINTIVSLGVNGGGGRDITKEIVTHFNRQFSSDL